MDKGLLSLAISVLCATAFACILSESVVRDSQDDRDWRNPRDFWGGTRVLYQGTSVPDDAPDPREQDREWCHVNGFWSDEFQGMVVLNSEAASTGSQDPAFRLIELSVAAFDEEPETPD